MSQNDLKPNYSSTDGEETSASDSDEVSYTDSGEKQQQQTNKTLIAPLKSAHKPQASDPASSEAAESGSDTDTASGSDSDSPPKSLPVADPNVKPISSVPTEPKIKRNDSKLVKKVESKAISTPSLSKSKRPPAAPAKIENNAKKAKQNSVNEEPNAALISPSKSGNKPQVPNLSSSDAESSSNTDSDLPPKKSNVVDSKNNAISPVPVESKSVKISGSKTIPTPSPAKRKPSAPTAVKQDAKKAKNMNTSTAPDDNTKKQLFQRMFSEYDEIVILKGMIDYKVEKNGESHIADISEFHEFIKKLLHADVSNTQLADKVKRMKKKYVNNAGREKDGKDPSFSKTHEQKSYELSKLIWGSNNSGTESKKNLSRKKCNSKSNAAATSTGTANLLTSNGINGKQKSKMEVEKKIDVSSFIWYGGLYDSLILPEEIVKAGMELVDGSRWAELEMKWKELKEQELVLYVRRMELLKEQALVILEAIRSSGN